jgi:hypothetical protein
MSFGSFIYDGVSKVPGYIGSIFNGAISGGGKFISGTSSVGSNVLRTGGTTLGRQATSVVTASGRSITRTGSGAITTAKSKLSVGAVTAYNVGAAVWTRTYAIILVILTFLVAALFNLPKSIQTVLNYILNRFIAPTINGLYKRVKSLRDINRELNSGNKICGSLTDLGISLVLFVIEFFILIIILTLSILKKIIEYQFWIIVLLLATLVFTYFEHNHTTFTNTLHNVVLVGEVVTDNVFGFTNFVLDMYEIGSNFLNEQIRSTVQYVRITWQGLKPDDANIVSRRLVEDDNIASIISFSDRKAQLKEVADRTTYGANLMNVLGEKIYGLLLAIISPFIEVLFDVFLVFASKTVCFARAPLCGVREFFHQAIDGFLGLFRSITILGFQPFASFRIFGINCLKDYPDLLGVDAAICGGYLYEVEPPGAFYSDLSKSTSTNRRLLQQTEALLICEQHPHDHSWIEKLNGKVIHKSHINKCPLTSRTRASDNMMDHVETMKHLNLKGNCFHTSLHKEDIEEICWHTHNATIGRRQLFSLFNEDGKRILTKINKKYKASTSEINSDVLYQIIHEKLGDDIEKKGADILSDEGKIIFHCDLFDTDSKLNIYQQTHNQLCVLSKLISSGTLKVSVPSWLGPNNDGGRRVLQQEENKRYYEGLDKNLHVLSQHVYSIKQHIRIQKTRRILRDRNTPYVNQDDINWKEAAIPILQPKKNKTIITPENKRRKLEQKLGICPAGYHPCIMSGDCILLEEREFCPQTNNADEAESPNNGVLLTIGKALEDISTFNIDGEDILTDANRCYDRYDQRPETSPLSYTNLILQEQASDDQEYCLGMVPPITYRLPKIQRQGLNRYVSDLCVNDNCYCFWYYEKYGAYELSSLPTLHVDIEYTILNFLISIQYIVGMFFSIPGLHLIALAWSSFWNLAGHGRFPLWFTYILSDMGLGISPQRGAVCFVIYLGSYFNTLLILLMIYILGSALQPILKVLSYKIHIFTDALKFSSPAPRKSDKGSISTIISGSP